MADMLSISTSFRDSAETDPERFVANLEQLGVRGVELEYRLTDRFFARLRSPLQQSGLTVASIHNYFPFPTRFEKLKPGGDLFLLSSPEKDERKRAVTWTTRTIEMANDLEAGVVVLHCGKVEMNSEFHKLHRYFDESAIVTPEAQTFIAQKLQALQAVKPAYLDNLLFSLDRLVSVADKQGVILAFENRAHYHELPGSDDFERLLAEFDGGPVGYWHDTGHAHLSEALTIMPPGYLLEKYAEKLVGFHFHDAVGLNDHLPPGTGEIDFAYLKSHLKPDIPLVIELKPGTPHVDVRKGIDFMKDFLI